jgi:hypothetical protein
MGQAGVIGGFGPPSYPASGYQELYQCTGLPADYGLFDVP